MPDMLQLVVTFPTLNLTETAQRMFDTLQLVVSFEGFNSLGGRSQEGGKHETLNLIRRQ
jgi:hypothetical protein